MTDLAVLALADVYARLAKARAERAAKTPHRKTQFPHVSRLLGRMAQRKDTPSTLAAVFNIELEAMYRILEGNRIPRGARTLAKIAAYLGEDARALTAEIAAIPAERRLAKVAPKGSDWL